MFEAVHSILTEYAMHTNITANSDSEQLQTLSRDEFWNLHITQWRESGLSKKANCNQYSLVYQQMVYWCSKSTTMKNKEKKPCRAFSITLGGGSCPHLFAMRGYWNSCWFCVYSSP